MIDQGELRALRDGVHALAVDGVAGLAGAELGALALEARRLREQAEYLEVHALGALEDTGYTDAVHGMSTAGWFAREAGLPGGAARAQVALARVLRRDLHATDAAWLDGRLTREHVRVLADAANPRIRKAIVGAEEQLIALVAGRTFLRWRQGVSSLVSSLDQDGPDPDDPSSTTATWARSGAFGELRARFGGASAEVVEQAIEAKTDELFRRQAKDRERSTDIPARSRAQLRALAIVELLHLGMGIDQTSSKAPTTGVSLVLRTDAVTEDDDDDGWPRLASFADATWSLTNPDGRHLAIEHFATLLCDCAVHPLVVDGDGNPLRLGRTRRFASTAQRRAVLARDGGCVFPGCDCPVSWSDIHHVEAFADGGPTDIDSLAALCRHHHGVSHRKGWEMGAVGDGWFRWWSPSGHTIDSQRHGHQRAGPAPPGRVVDAA